jgi:hypothetical protein
MGSSPNPPRLLNGVVRLSRMTLLERCCWIPRRPGPGDPHFEGLMDELVICNRDLTAEELQELIKK